MNTVFSQHYNGYIYNQIMNSIIISNDNQNQVNVSNGIIYKTDLLLLYTCTCRYCSTTKTGCHDIAEILLKTQ